MRPVIITDFLKNRTIQQSIGLSILINITLAGSIKHTLILFGLPYLTSVALHSRFKPQKKKMKARISKQYKPSK